jgi:hypothetical protein
VKKLGVGNMNEKLINENKSNFFAEANDLNHLKITKELDLGMMWFNLLMLLGGLYFVYRGLVEAEPLVYIGLIWCVVCLVFIIKLEIKRRRKGVIDYSIDRLENKITFPSNIYKRQTTIYNFESIKIDFKLKRVYQKREDEQHYLIYLFTNEITDDTFVKDWSFIAWYMDKNRPLPIGDAFDEYRLQDFERRKAEGFPRPGYPSNISTPEATPEQQEDREKIGGW